MFEYQDRQNNMIEWKKKLVGIFDSRQNATQNEYMMQMFSKTSSDFNLEPGKAQQYPRPY